MVKEKCRKKWQERWSQARDKDGKEMYRQTRLLYPKPEYKIKDLSSYDRKGLGQIVGLITGHCNVRYHRHNINPDAVADQRCRLCDSERETSWHLLARCPALIEIRNKLWQRYEIRPNENWEWKFKDMKKFVKQECIQRILKYELEEEE